MQIQKDEIRLDRNFPFAIFRYEAPRAEGEPENYHWHEFMEVTCILSGKGRYYVNGHTYQVEAGDMIIFNNIDVHGWTAAEQMELLVMTFATELISDGTQTLEYDYLLPFLERGSNFQNKIDRTEEYTPVMTRIMEETFAEYQEQSVGFRLMIKANVLRLLTILMRHYQKGELQKESLSVRKKQMKRLEKAFTYIKENYDKKVTLEEAATLAYMSPNYFSAYFKKVTGKNLREYVVEQRVKKAAELLQNSSLSLQEVEQECGFTNTSNFYRLFKKHMGISPGEMRKKV
ncbi:MAG: AraC family transcriptional regulator [Eubacteriales bacterium]|nr:AraC family transcriptional regulator [Eubacteriales bacterium]